jgi:hypothetical protein
MAFRITLAQITVAGDADQAERAVFYWGNRRPSRNYGEFSYGKGVANE